MLLESNAPGTGCSQQAPTELISDSRAMLKMDIRRYSSSIMGAFVLESMTPPVFSGSGTCEKFPSCHAGYAQWAWAELWEILPVLLIASPD